MDIKEKLEELGYRLTEFSDYYRTNALYRHGDGRHNLAICKKTGRFSDFATGTTGSFKQLVELSDGTLSDDELEKIKNNEISFSKDDEYETQFDPSILSNLEQDYSYWIGRGISEETCKLFGGGICKVGKMQGRFVFPIWNIHKTKIQGITGRTLRNHHSKYKHIGRVKEWIWPAYLNKEIIKESKSVILVESPADVLAAAECDIYNVICLFGLQCSDSIINFLISLSMSVNKIIISTNNDTKNTAGQQAAFNIQNKLLNYFDNEIIKIHFPKSKDINDQLLQYGQLNVKQWYKNNL